MFQWENSIRLSDKSLSRKRSGLQRQGETHYWHRQKSVIANCLRHVQLLVQKWPKKGIVSLVKIHMQSVSQCLHPPMPSSATCSWMSPILNPWNKIPQVDRSVWKKPRQEESVCIARCFHEYPLWSFKEDLMYFQERTRPFSKIWQRRCQLTEYKTHNSFIPWWTKEERICCLWEEPFEGGSDVVRI